MRDVLVLGAGRVSAPLIRYLRDVPETRVTVADSRAGAAELTLDVTDEQALRRAVAGKHLVVSMVPPTFHPTASTTGGRSYPSSSRPTGISSPPSPRTRGSAGKRSTSASISGSTPPQTSSTRAPVPAPAPSRPFPLGKASRFA